MFLSALFFGVVSGLEACFQQYLYTWLSVYLFFQIFNGAYEIGFRKKIKMMRAEIDDGIGGRVIL